MGRKIPGRKHRGVRDPEKQREERFNAIRTKINAPPTNADHQAVPKSLSRIIELKEKIKSGEIPSKRKRKHKKKTSTVSIKPMKIRSGEKPIPGFTQHPGEKNQQFLRRINQACQIAIKETAFEEKYGVSVKHNPDTGEVEGVEKKPKDELELYMKKVKKEQKMKGKKKKKKKEGADEPKLTKSQKRQIKLAERKERKSERSVDEFTMYKDRVGFGEVVHAPPTLVKPRKIKHDNEAPRPGKKNLLLKSILNGKSNDDSSKQNNRNKKMEPKGKLRGTANKIIDRKGKRRDLPNATRRQLDKQQSEIIQAYKELKKKRYTNK